MREAVDGEDVSPSENSLLRQILTAQAAATANITTLLEDRNQAAESRRKIHEGIGALGTQVALLGQRLERIEPLVDKHEAGRNQAAGVVWAMRSGWAVAGAGVLTGVAWVFRKLGVS